MDEKHQDKAENNLTTTENKLWLPSLSPKVQKKLKRFQKKPFIERAGLKGKTLWDWLQLLIIPFVLAVGGILFSTYQHNADQQRALDQQQATILQTYIDNIQDLLLNHHLLGAKPGDDVAVLARARTLTALQGLDGSRKGVLIQFLYDAHLIGFVDNNKQQPSIVELFVADLRGADLRDAILRGADLRFAVLMGADLFDADLSGADLSGADLRGANLDVAGLSGADLILADLRGANLSNADLKGAKVTSEDLAQASSLAGATMPDGSKHP